jgi:hypothetical protein
VRILLDECLPRVIVLMRGRVAAAFAPEHRREVMVSIADELRAEVRLEGRLEALRESLLEQLEIKFSPVDSAVRARVEQAPIEQVTAWMRRIVVVSTLGEVFEG